MSDVRIFTIGFTGTTAEGFFDRLRRAGVKKVIDIDLYNHLLIYTNISKEEKKHHAQKALEAKQRL